MKLADFLAEDAIVVELQATDRNGVLREMVQSLADHSHLNPEDVEPIARALIHRENQGSTGFGKGVAVPSQGYRRHDRSQQPRRGFRRPRPRAGLYDCPAAEPDE
jgi:mannitol/fructose-specific phosphotransferase system IIA component